YYDGSDLIGYVELGEEIDHFLKILKGDTNNEFAIIVDKEYLNREDWRSVRKVAGLRDNWNDSEKHLLLTSTTEEGLTTRCFVEDNLKRIEDGESHLSQIQSKNQTFICGGFPITDAGERHIGAVLSLIDITDNVAIAQKSNYTLLITAIILFLITFSTGIVVTRSISRPIIKLNDAVNEIGSGNLNAKIEIRSNDEFGQLAASFKKMTEDLQKTTVSKDYVDNIIGSMFGTLVVTNPKGSIQTVNQATCTLLGYRVEELIGQPADVLFADGNSGGSWYDELIEKGSITNMEKTYQAKDGRKIPMLFSGSIMHDSGGRVQGIVCIAQDITERRRVEEMRLENERLMLSSKAKSEFLTTMSHELRTPLNSIIGFSELLKQKIPGELNEKQERYVNNVLTGGNNLLKLINDILDLSRVEAGNIDLEIEKVSLQAVIDESLNLIKEKAGAHNILLKKELDPGLDTIEADKQRIKQVLYNLINNAIKFSKPNGGTVTISTRKEGYMAKISVSDTGIGIKEEEMGRLFKEFEQLDSGSTRKYGGTGLGLVISKKLVELHGGNVIAESRFGEGSTFTFTLPIEAKKGEGT
ncbi:MAG TPA: ATP-binding protein, partial [candidate division Zixibacteria bacterium]|nr:ATP-binding protein [candidate division Zixibacteria bacterium]